MENEASKALIADYFARLGTGDPSLPELLADDVVWMDSTSGQRTAPSGASTVRASP